MASISKTKPRRANLRPILTPFPKPHQHSSLPKLLANSEQPPQSLSSDNFHSNGMYIIAGNDMAITRPLGPTIVELICQLLYHNYPKKSRPVRIRYYIVKSIYITYLKCV